MAESENTKSTTSGTKKKTKSRRSDTHRSTSGKRTTNSGRKNSGSRKKNSSGKKAAEKESLLDASAAEGEAAEKAALEPASSLPAEDLPQEEEGADDPSLQENAPSGELKEESPAEEPESESSPALPEEEGNAGNDAADRTADAAKSLAAPASFPEEDHAEGPFVDLTGGENPLPDIEENPLPQEGEAEEENSGDRTQEEAQSTDAPAEEKPRKTFRSFWKSLFTPGREEEADLLSESRDAQEEAAEAAESEEVPAEEEKTVDLTADEESSAEIPAQPEAEPSASSQGAAEQEKEEEASAPEEEKTVDLTADEEASDKAPAQPEEEPSAASQSAAEQEKEEEKEEKPSSIKENPEEEKTVDLTQEEPASFSGSLARTIQEAEQGGGEETELLSGAPSPQPSSAGSLAAQAAREEEETEKQPKAEPEPAARADEEEEEEGYHPCHKTWKGKLITFVLYVVLFSVVICGSYLATLEYCTRPIGEDGESLEFDTWRTWILTSDTEYTITTYDMSGGTYMPTSSDSKSSTAIRNLHGAVRLLQEQNPNILLFQEIDKSSTRSGKVDETALLSSMITGYSNVFCPNYHTAYNFFPLHDPQGMLDSGLYAMSQYRISSAERNLLPWTTKFPQKYFAKDACFETLYMTVTSGRTLVLINVDFSEVTGQEWKNQLTRLTTFAAEQYEEGRYVIIAGNFRAEMQDEENGLVAPANASVVLDAESLPSGFRIVVPDNHEELDTDYRHSGAYDGKKRDSIRCGFIVTENVEASSTILDSGFQYSPYNPVLLRFKLTGE